MAVINLDKVAGQHLESIQAPAVLKNGYFLQLGALVDGETELRLATAPTDIEGEDLVLHATPEVDPDPRKAGLKHFEVAQGEKGRAYRLVKGDIITLTEDLFGTLPAIGDLVSPQVGSFLLDGFDSAVVNPTLQFKVIQERTLGYDQDKAFSIQVIKA